MVIGRSTGPQRINKTGLHPEGWYDTPFFIPFAVSSDSALANTTAGRIPGQSRRSVRLKSNSACASKKATPEN
jgi:hypothetical protein